jgi:hypothetical protein
MIQTLTLVFVTIALLSSMMGDVDALSERKVNAIAYNGFNFIFRGDEPLANTTFAYDELVRYMSNKSKTQLNVSLPANFTLIDVSYDE